MLAPWRKGSGGGEALQAALEILDQVIGVLEPDVEAQTVSRRLPPGSGAVVARVEREHEALETAEARADAEMLQPVDERGHRGLGEGLEHHGEESGRTGKVTLPDRVARVVGQRRVEHAVHLGPDLEPLR